MNRPVASCASYVVGHRGSGTVVRVSRPVEAALTIGEARRLLSRVGFLEALPAGELDELARRAAFSRLGVGGTFVVGPEEHAERMLLVLGGRLQVYEADPSGRELTLYALEGGSFSGRRASRPDAPASCARGRWSPR